MARRPYYNNDYELTRAIQADLKQAMRYVGDENEKNLQTSFTKVGVPVEEGGVGTAWKKETLGMTHNIESYLGYDPSKLSIEPENYRHSSPIGSSFRNFAELIDKGLGGYMTMFGGENNPTRRPRPFWRTFINITDRELYSNIFPKCCQKAHIGGLERK